MSVLSFSLINVGDAPGIVNTVYIRGINAASYTVVEPPTTALPKTIQPDESMTISIKFSPVVLGSNIAELVITTLHGQTLLVPLRGNGISRSSSNDGINLDEI